MKRALVLLGLVLALGVSLAAAAEASPSAVERLETLDQQIIRGLNTTRAKHGLRPLVMSDDLQNAAVAHSRSMLAKGFFAHDSPGGAPFAARVKGYYRPAGYNSWSIGENLLYTTAEITADAAIKAWLDSPGHRENMLAPQWREVGIGSLRTNAAAGVFDGEPTWVITMDFGARTGKTVRKPAATRP